MKIASSDATIIVTTYNDSVEDLSCALSSAASQSLTPKQILVVDDGSNNDTADLIVRKMQDRYDVPITLLKKQNGGPSSARNYGLRHCFTRYVTFLDSDDEMLGDNLEKKENCLSMLADDYFGVYGSYIKNPGGVHKYMEHDGLADPNLVGHNKGMPGGVHTYLFRTEYLTALNGFDEDLVHNEDFDLIIRLIKRSLKVKGSLGAGFIRNYRENSVSRNNKYFETYENINRFLAKAEENDYFSAQELAARKSGNELRLARQLLRQRSLRTQGLSHLNSAFDYSSPKGLKQYIAFILARGSRLVVKI